MTATVGVFNGTSVVLFDVFITKQTVASVFGTFGTTVVIKVVAAGGTGRPTVLNELFYSLGPTFITDFYASGMRAELIAVPHAALTVVWPAAGAAPTVGVFKVGLGVLSAVLIGNTGEPSDSG